MRSRLQPVADEPAPTFDIGEPAPEVRAVSVPEKQLMSMLVQGFGQRAMAMLSMIFTLLLAGSAFCLWWAVLQRPTTAQLVGLGGYAGFVLALEYVRRR
jgi:hypothetical protein